MTKWIFVVNTVFTVRSLIKLNWRAFTVPSRSLLFSQQQVTIALTMVIAQGLGCLMIVVVPENGQETRQEERGNKEGEGGCPCYGSVIDHLNNERRILKSWWKADTIMSVNGHFVTTRRNIVQWDKVCCIPPARNWWNVSRSSLVPSIIVPLWIKDWSRKFIVICIWNQWTWER